MNVTTITASQFMSQFFRDFPYLNIWVANVTYNAGTRVYDSGSGLFYNSLINGNINVEPDSDLASWQEVCDNINNYVQTQDINNAFLEAQVVYNPGLYCSDNSGTLAYLYLTAHYLCNDLRASSQGINSAGSFPVASRGVGSVSESYQIPDRYKDDPMIAMFTSTSYGMKFLSMTLPSLIGNMAAVWGGALPG